MNENIKTSAFVGAAVVLLGLGVWASIPSPDPDLAGRDIGKEFFPEFLDPLKVASASIAELDSDSDVKHDLTVERRDGVWQVNPGKQGYEQISIDRLSDIVKAVIGAKKLAIVTDSPERHREFNVVDPTNETELKTGTDGVGKRITLKGDDGKTLVDLIVGKADEKNAKIIFARVPGKDRVYTTEVDTARLSSDFGDWVVGDLLQTKDKTLQTVKIDDYGIDKKNVRQAVPGQGGIALMSQRTVLVEHAKADFKKEAGKWTVGTLEVFDQAKGTYVPRQAGADEEFDQTKLDDLQRELTDLKIVDAVRKPKVLAEDLKSDKLFLNNQASPVWRDEESFEELQLAGFRLNPKEDKTFEIVSHDGDMLVGFSNGIRYHLRFGDITGKGRIGAAEEGKPNEAKPGVDAKPAAEADAGDGAAEGANTAPNRYLMVMATFDETLVPKPELTKLPEEKPEAAKPADSKPAEAAKPAAGGSAPNAGDARKEEKPADEKKADAPKAENPAAANDSGACNGAGDELAQAPETKPAETKPADAKPAADAATSGDKKPTEVKPTEVKPDDDATTKPAEKKEEPKVVDPPMTPEERKRIESENKQKQEKYEADVKAGREKAKELNAQYAEWFYVISDATFRDIHLDPTTLLKKKAASGEAPAAGAAPAGQFGLPPGGLLPPGAN